MKFLALILTIVSSVAYADISTFLNVASHQKELAVTSCPKAFVQKKCDVTIETKGYSGNVLYALYSRLANGELVPLKAGNLDIVGKAVVPLVFQEPKVFNLVVFILDKNVPVALSGVILDVYPDSRQLGEQVQSLIFSAHSSFPEDEDQEDPNYDPWYGRYVVSPDDNLDP